MILPKSISMIILGWLATTVRHRGGVHAFLGGISTTTMTTTTTITTTRPFTTASQRLYSNFISVSDAIQEFQQKQQQEGKNHVVRFVDGSWYHRGTANEEFRAAFQQGPRIPGSVYFDLGQVCDNQSSLWGMLPKPDYFGRVMDDMGIQPNTHVIIYGQDQRAVFLPRVWFTFACRMKHPGRVSILSGTFQDWIQQNGPTDHQPVKIPPPISERSDGIDNDDADMTTSIYFQNREIPDDSKIVVDSTHVLKDIHGQDTIILDSRGSSFAKKGHIPGSVHIPYKSLMSSNKNNNNNNHQDGSSSLPSYMKDRESLRAIFEQAGIDIHTDKTIVCSCGSGVSACSIYLALQECGRTQKTVLYDGSWQEWKQLDDMPKVLPTKEK